VSPGVEPEELTHGLWRWSAPHPDWQPGAPGSPEDWPREVGSALFQTSATALFVDPQLPSDTKPFWRWADACCAGRAVAVLTTIAFHSRSRDAFIERYGAVSYDGTDDEQILPGGIQCFPIPSRGETLVWLARDRTLITGDAILGAGNGGLRLCPESWLDHGGEAITLEGLRGQLRALLVLPIERVLVSHGDSVLGGGHAALSAALAPVAAAA